MAIARASSHVTIAIVFKANGSPFEARNGYDEHDYVIDGRILDHETRIADEFAAQLIGQSALVARQHVFADFSLPPFG